MTCLPILSLLGNVTLGRNLKKNCIECIKIKGSFSEVAVLEHMTLPKNSLTSQIIFRTFIKLFRTIFLNKVPPSA